MLLRLSLALLLECRCCVWLAGWMLITRCAADGSNNHHHGQWLYSFRSLTIKIGGDVLQPLFEFQTDLAWAIARVYMRVHYVTTCIAWLGTACGGKSGCISNNMVKAEIEVVLGILTTSVADGLQLLVDYEELWPAFDKLPSKLAYTASRIHGWLSQVRVELRSMADWVVQQMVDTATHFTKIVQSRVPAFEHYLNDEKMLVKLVKTKLLHYGARDALTADSVVLWKLLNDIGRFREKFASVPTSSDDDPYQEALADGTTTFKAAKRAMTIIAACNAVFAMTGDEQRAECSKLASKGAELPTPLLDAVRTCAARRGAAPPKALADAP